VECGFTGILNFHLHTPIDSSWILSISFSNCREEEGTLAFRVSKSSDFPYSREDLESDFPQSPFRAHFAGDYTFTGKRGGGGSDF
jgi:hypothetical protein